MNIILNKRTPFLILFSFTLAPYLICQDILLVEKPGTVNNYKYYVNDFVSVKTIFPDTVFSGKISEIRDSSFVISYNNEVFIKNIDAVYRSRYGINLLQKIFLIGGGAYLSLLTINGVISSDTGEINKIPFIVAGSLIVAGIAIIPLKKRKMKTENYKWRIKIIRV